MTFNEDVARFEPEAAAQMERLLFDLQQVNAARKAALLEVQRAQHDALLRLARAAEYRDDDTGVHIVRLGMLSRKLALRLGQDAGYAEMLKLAAPMHDIGKIGIPDAVLKKPGPLTADEREIMNRHPAIGAEILGRSESPVFLLAAEVAMTHHERFDGRGYPHGLCGQAIPLSGRIVGVVDFFDALTMDRVYRPAFSDEVALEMLLAQSGKAFDPWIVRTFFEHVREFTACRDALNQQRPDLQALLA
ncbi:HD-GYP domain-containing protein [Ideonella sp.]|uniref:HD-GYP domain-containing protein n=1 Tax=Ideonella sp. TaxID=1929293 RepID=UPI0035B2A566